MKYWLSLLFACTSMFSHADKDWHSFAEPDQVKSTHISLDLSVNFDKKTVSGSVTHDIKRVVREAKTFVVDTRDLVIEKVETNAGEWKRAKYELGNVDAIRGQALRISVPFGANKVRITYSSQPQASGLQWLSKEMTAGKAQPFMFSQAQAIHARSFIPLQDSPQVRITYDATIRTPKALRAVMSADNDPKAELNGVFQFKMPQAIPSYLIAIAVGDLQFAAMSERTGIYAEPSMIKASLHEFADTEKMVQTTEAMYGPYAWGRYDLLILPPSFPFGGMENPRLSFITPTVLAGDRSQVSLIAHELAHSWSGNLVTNSTWRDLWINEGFTSYVENRIMEKIYGRDRAVMEQVLGLQGLAVDLNATPQEDQTLTPKTEGRDPDDTFSQIPYVKGQMFLHYLEDKFGRETFDAFLKSYFKDHAFGTINTEAFVVYLKTHLLQKHPNILSEAKLNEWLFGTGMPADAPAPHTDRFEKVEAQWAAFAAGKITAKALKTKDWSMHEWAHFLNQLVNAPTVKQMSALDQAFQLSKTPNNELAFTWLLASIRADYQPAKTRLENYLLSIGRRKFVIPLYEELAKTKANKEWAIDVFSKAKVGYHPITIASAEKVLK